MDEVRAAVLAEAADVDGSGVRVAVLDTGVDPEHPDLVQRVSWADSASLCLSSNIRDRHGHGTHIAGIIAGTGEASDGKFRGIAPGAELIILKVQEGTSGFALDVAAGVERAIERGADIINYSGGTEGYHLGQPPWKWPAKLDTRDRAFVAAVDRGILCVAAAGNEGPDDGTVIRPGNLESLLQVGCVGLPSGYVADQSARGPVFIDPTARTPSRADLLMDTPSRLTKPDVVAPGGDGLPLEQLQADPLYWMEIRTTGVTSCRSREGKLLPIPPDDRDAWYARMSGTSQATAVVSGLAALLVELGRRHGVDWGGNQAVAVRQILRASAMRLSQGSPRDFGYGTLLWNNVVATFSDFATSADVRRTILGGRELRLC